MRPILIMLLLAVLKCPAAEQITNLNLGDPLPSDARETEIYVLVSPAQMLPEYKWVDRGIEYSLAAHQGRLEYIATSSPEAQTPEGVRVGQTLEEVLRAQNVEVKLRRGWGYVVELRSGWKAALFLEGQFLDRRPVATDQIDLLFKGTA